MSRFLISEKLPFLTAPWVLTTKVKARFFKYFVSSDFLDQIYTAVHCITPGFYSGRLKPSPAAEEASLFRIFTEPETSFRRHSDHFRDISTCSRVTLAMGSKGEGREVEEQTRAFMTELPPDGPVDSSSEGQQEPAWRAGDQRAGCASASSFPQLKSSEVLWLARQSAATSP